MNTYQIRKAAEEFEIPDRIAVKMRARYLVGRLDLIEAYVNRETNEVPELGLDEILTELLSYDTFLKIKTPAKDSISEEDILRAREYPIEHLVEFVNGKSLAWCHEDKRPSLTHYKKGNKATCFPCGKTYNPIDVLIERDGLSFVEAVKKLCK